MFEFLSNFFSSVIIAVSVLFGGHTVPAVQPSPATSTVSISPPAAVLSTPPPSIVSQDSSPSPKQTIAVVVPNPDVIAQPSSKASAPPDSTYCNGIYYSSCPSGQDLICPTNGDAYCQPDVSTVIAQQQDQQHILDILIDPLNKRIASLQSQSDSCLSKISSSLNFVEGAAQVTQQVQASECQNVTSELSDLLVARGYVQQGGNLTKDCIQRIISLEQQVYDLRDKALKSEAGELTTGTYEIGSARAQQIAALESSQESPLLQQIQQNIYYCST
jgi:hypothetical protein